MVITGGSSGIGAVLVSRFAEKGVKVLILDRNTPPTELGKSRLSFKIQKSTFNCYSPCDILTKI